MKISSLFQNAEKENGFECSTNQLLNQFFFQFTPVRTVEVVQKVKTIEIVQQTNVNK